MDMAYLNGKRNSLREHFVVTKIKKNRIMTYK